MRNVHRHHLLAAAGCTDRIVQSIGRTTTHLDINCVTRSNVVVTSDYLSELYSVNRSLVKNKFKNRRGLKGEIWGI